MKKAQGWLLLLSAMAMPWVVMFYLYTQNAEYLSFTQVVYAAAVMSALSALGFGVLRWIFRSPMSAFAGCAVTWLVFFGYGCSASVAEFFKMLVSSYARRLQLYFGAGFVLLLVSCLAVRKVRSGAGFVALFMALMLAMNAVPAVNRSQGSAYAVELDESFACQVDPSLPSPNVYWFHTDGMLGFEAYEKYFGDDQAQFAASLEGRGFEINKDAYFECAHTTSLAVPALLCPDFYDREMAPALQSHESALQYRKQVNAGSMAVDEARINNETRMSFDQKQYTTVTISPFNAYYPPLTDYAYLAVEGVPAQRLMFKDNVRFFQAIVDLHELSSLLLRLSTSNYYSIMTRAVGRGLFGDEIWQEELGQYLTMEERAQLLLNQDAQKRYAAVCDALAESTRLEKPTFTIIHYMAPHGPFTLDEQGVSQGTSMDPKRYQGSHVYAAGLLSRMIDMVLEADPDAVIVLQADHGLHMNSKAELNAALGEGCETEVWNQVFSAIRVPERYKNGDERYAVDDPLNMSRYLVNSFVGKNYEYIQ